VLHTVLTGDSIRSLSRKGTPRALLSDMEVNRTVVCSAGWMLALKRRATKGAYPTVLAVTVGVACGGSAKSGSANSASASACDHLFQATIGCTSGPIPPTSEQGREQGRFEQACGSSLTQPGVTYTAEDVDACASALESNCNATCSIPAGTLASGAPCTSGDQCQSGFCGRSVASNACGTCSTPITNGDSCLEGMCVPGSVCSPTTLGDSSAASAAGTCVAATNGGQGAPCDGNGPQCGPELYCDFGTSTPMCKPLGGQGAACAGSTACKWPLVCVGLSGSILAAGPPGTCQSQGGSGAACSSDTDCASPLACNAGKCGSVTWVQPGQPCPLASDRCIVGAGGCTEIVVGGSGPKPPQCLTVIADGEPCNPEDATSTCDVFSNCEAIGDAGAVSGGETCVLGTAACM